MELQLIEHKLRLVKTKTNNFWYFGFRIADNRLQALKEDSITKSSTFKIGGAKKDWYSLTAYLFYLWK